MATLTGAHSVYDENSLGNREDLSDMIWDVSPTDTPGIQAIGKGKSTNTLHQWLTDTLSTGNANAQVEGEDVTHTNPADRVRLTNYTQIFRKDSAVTETQEQVLKGGDVTSEMAYQMERRMTEIKTDVEFSIFGVDNAKVAGSTSAARELGSLSSYLANGVAGTEFAAATSANPTGDGTDTPTKGGTDRALTETILDGTLANLYTNSGGNKNIMAICDASQRQVFSTFTASSTRYVTTDDKRLVASIDVYDGDFHTVKIVPDRFCIAGSVFLIDPEYLKLADLRSIYSKDLAENGDAMRKAIYWETTLEVCDPNAHTHIFDLT